jgi:murein L,D-transpeptidase YafK
LPLLALACSQADARKSNKYDAIDSCLRGGGAWNYRSDQCQASDPGPVDSIYIDKSDHWMTVYRGGRIVREFRVSLGRGGLAPKQRRGDHRVPEGAYLIAGHNPRSGYHLSLRIGYPTVEQIAAAQAIGTEAGGDIMIHGLPNGDGDVGSRQQRIDWTDGCIALTDPEIDWLYRAVPDGTPVRIVP